MAAKFFAEDVNILAKRKKKNSGSVSVSCNKIKISLCYIVKNCAQDLQRSLESAAKYVDEIIVVDTGSSDSTVDVAEKFGAKILHEPWQDDFSTPRNKALAEATGDWIVFLDSDEFFVNGTAKNLRTAMKNAKRNKNCSYHKKHRHRPPKLSGLGKLRFIRFFRNLRQNR